MHKNLGWKFALIIGLVVVAAWTLYPPSRTLKPGIDLGGGTSLIYEIDTQGLSAADRQGLSGRMITILRRRIDPAAIQNLVWRPQGNTRFEIQMPLATAEARVKRQQFEQSLGELLAENINAATVMRSLTRPAEERAKDFKRFAQDSNERANILNNLAGSFDQRKQLQQKRDELAAGLRMPESLIKLAGFDLESIQLRVVEWMKLNDEQLKKTLLDFLGSENNLDLLTRYTKMYADWASAVNSLTDPEKGVNLQFNKARQSLDELNISEDQITSVLESGNAKSLERQQAVETLKAEHPQRAAKIDRVVAAYDAYYPFRGRLDDPADLQRMLKGAGILEFRILPTLEHPDVDTTQMETYVATLKSKGPKYASDNKYIWCEIENNQNWHASDAQRRPSIAAQFGNKWYVLASNRKDEVMLHGPQNTDWRLVRASAGQDQSGRMAIDFVLDQRGGEIFQKVTGKNIDRPLCILLDGTAISAPNINSRIYTRGQITGSFTSTEVDDMVNKLNAGSLPARLVEQPLSIRTIGPSIGADNRDRGIRAGIIGLMGVLTCMAGYYLLGGMIADAALLINLLFTLAIMAMMDATFTLPGIAGTILTIGMSVDANVLIFERIREEQMKGSSLAIAIKNGYERAFSAIFDSNLTTILTAAILYWVASEEIKGFALVLMLGLASSMFTALFVTRAIFDFLLKKRLIKDHLVMLHLIKKPNINWMAYRPVFFVLSGILTIGGLIIFFTRDNTKNNKYDIEFTGGTSVQINLKDTANLTRQDIEDRIHGIGAELNNRAIAAATVYSIGKSGRQYEINTTETNKTVATVSFPSAGQWTPESIAAAIGKAESQRESQLSNLMVTAAQGGSPSFTIRTTQLNTGLVADVLKTAFPDASISEPKVDEVVSSVVLRAFENELLMQQSLQPKIVSTEKITEAMVDNYPELVDFLGGVMLKVETARAATADELEQRIKNLRFKPDMRHLNWYSFRLLNSELGQADANEPVKSFVYVSSEPGAAFGEMSEDVWTQFVENETTKVLTAAQIETSLPQVTQIDPSVGAEAKTRASIAIVLSLIAMLIYLWFRFGDLRFGLGGVITLFHDTCVTVGMVTACTYIAGTAIGQALLIGDFKIDLAMIAAFLTLLGYSINDSIVIYDRIRENRRKGTLTPQIINNSINETLSRTLLTGTTTLLVVAVMYIFGGKGLRGFNFAMLFGIIEGTYSSIAISAPILLLTRRIKEPAKPKTENAKLQGAKA
jgi:SecD/SecF fusion protein